MLLFFFLAAQSLFQAIETGVVDNDGNKEWNFDRTLGTEYVAHDAVLMSLVAKLVQTESEQGIKRLHEKIIESFHIPNSCVTIPAANILAGVPHQITALYDRTLFACIHPV